MIQIVVPDQDVYERSLATCDKLEAATNVILDYDLTIEGYADALAALAQDDFATYSGEFDELSKSLTTFFDSVDASDTDKTRGKAAISLLSFIATAATEGYRQKELRKAFEQHDNIANVAHAIKEKVEFVYDSSLQNELGAIRSARQVIEREQNQQVFAAGVLQRELKLQEADIGAKREVLKQYVTALEGLVATHDELRQDAEDLTRAELIAAVNNYGAQVYQLRRTLSSAFTD